MTEIVTHHRACNLCEAICGLEIKTQGDEIVSIKGDKNDPLSRGFICPKGTAVQDLQNDPNRLKQPVKKVNDEWQEISWEEAFELATSKMFETQDKYGNDALGIYVGNPTVHNYGSLTHGAPFSRALKTKNRFSATSLDQLPAQMACYFIYGHQFLIPIPDIDNCDYLVLIGANPMASNGSLWTVPDFPKRVKALKERNGKLINIDPRYTETSEVATSHHYIKPASDAFLLMAIIHTLFAEDLVNTGHLSNQLANIDILKASTEGFDAETVAPLCGIESEKIKEIARQLSSAKRAALYGRMGISTQIYGGLCNWAIQIINILCGNLDVEGGTLVTHPAVGIAKPGDSGRGNFGRAHSRVSGLPSFSGELPCAALAEEMLTPGDGQIKSFITMAGNPVLSAPNGKQLEKALSGLDFMLSIDFYINETTCHADLILPPTAPLEHDHFDIAFLRFATRNTVKFNEAVFPKPENSKHDWEILNALGQGLAEKRGEQFNGMPEPAVLIDFMMQAGYYTEHPEALPEGIEAPLTLEKVKEHPSGIDLGPLKPSFNERISTKDGLIELASEEMIKDIDRLKADIQENKEDKNLILIGRRHIRSNNSWLHNSQRLVKGKPRWQLLMHPQDMKTRNINDGEQVKISSRTNAITTQVSASEEIMPGVVSLPHGWGHQRKGVKMDIASQQEGVSANDITDEMLFDRLSGNSALNGVKVEVAPA